MTSFDRLRAGSRRTEIHALEQPPVVPATVIATPVVSAPVDESPVASGWVTETGEPIKADRHISPITRAQDALSRAEEAIYDALWRKSTDRDGGRFAVIGFERLGREARVTDKSAKASVRRLIEKQFIEVSRPAIIETRTPTEYRVFSYSDVLRRLSERGIGHCAKIATGVFYALLAGKATPVDTGCGNVENSKATPVATTPVNIKTTPVASSGHPYENKKQERTSVQVQVESAARGIVKPLCPKCEDCGFVYRETFARGIGSVAKSKCSCQSVPGAGRIK